MESPESGPKQRPAWLYVLLGCGGAAGLVCLIGALALGYCAKSVNDVQRGLTDPAERQANAIKQLGGLPDGYNVIASMSFFVMKTTVLTDAAPLPDGGFVVGDGHVFTYFHVMGNENNKAARDFLVGKNDDPRALAASGINIDVNQVVKRGTLTVDGRKFFYVASRGQVESGGFVKDALMNAILFDCTGDALSMGMWTQVDPSPEKNKEELELAGTVADEAELAGFLKPMNPCGR